MSEKQASKAFSFGSAWVLCQSLFTFFLLSMVIQTAVFIVSPKPKCPLSPYSALLVLWWEYALATGQLCEVLLLDTLFSHNMWHRSKFLSLTCVECGEIPTGFWFWGFFVLFYECVSVTDSGAFGRKDDMEWAVSLLQYKWADPGCRHMSTTGTRLWQ